MDVAQVYEQHAAAYAKLRLSIDEPELAEISEQLCWCAKRVQYLEQQVGSPQPKRNGQRNIKWQKRLSNWLTGVSSARNELIQLGGRIERLRARKKVFNARSIARYREEYDEICSIPRVRAIEVKSPNIFVMTDMLYSKNEHTRKWHMIGHFEITYNLATGSVSAIRWKNLSDISVKLGESRFYSPTKIGADGSRSCVGNAAKLLSDAYEKRNMVDLVSLLVRFPESPGDGLAVQLFPVVPHNEVPPWYLERFKDKPQKF